MQLPRSLNVSKFVPSSNDVAIDALHFTLSRSEIGLLKLSYGYTVTLAGTPATALYTLPRTIDCVAFTSFAVTVNVHGSASSTDP